MTSMSSPNAVEERTSCPFSSIFLAMQVTLAVI
jgi:hypothetical protein